MKTPPFEPALKKICSAAADAVYRYVEVSAEHPWTMPESFMVSYVFDKCGSDFTMTLETNAETLREWQRNSMARREGATNARPQDLEKLVSALGGEIDLVLFQGDPATKETQDIGVMLEFKKEIRGGMADVEKLMRLFESIHSCPMGAICVMAASPMDAEWLRKHQADAERQGHLWFACNVPKLPHGYNEHSVFLRAFANPRHQHT